MQRSRPRKSEKLPIVAANGFAPFPIPLHLIRAQFRERGYHARVVPFRMDDMRDVETYAAHIAAEIERTCTEFGVDRVHLLGYSMGGVAGLHALKRLGVADRVETFVGLGSPFHGSLASWLAVPTGIFSRTGSQLVPGSPYLKALHEEPLPFGPRYLTVAGTRDRVCPPRTALLAQTQHAELPIGHVDFITDRRVTDLIVRFLR